MCLTYLIILMLSLKKDGKLSLFAHHSGTTRMQIIASYGQTAMRIMKAYSKPSWVQAVSGARTDGSSA